MAVRAACVTKACSSPRSTGQKTGGPYEQADLAELAAAYAFGIARNHPFVDGNKRTSLLALYTFLGGNGVDFIVA